MGIWLKSSQPCALGNPVPLKRDVMIPVGRAGLGVEIGLGMTDTTVGLLIETL